MIINKSAVKKLEKVCKVPEGINRSKIIEIMEAFDEAFPDIGVPVIGFGGVLCLEGVRSITSDLDVSIRVEDAKYLEESGAFEYIIERASGTGREIPIYRCGVLDMHINELGFVEDAVMYENYRFKVMTLETILEFKKKWNRPKDQDDIKNIERVLRERRKGNGSSSNYSRLVDVAKVTPLDKDDIFKLGDVFSEYFPFLRESEIDDDSALCLYGVRDSVYEVLFTVPPKHEKYLRGFGIFHDSYIVENGNTIGTIKCGSLVIRFGDVIDHDRRFNKTFGYVVPSMEEILKRKSLSKDRDDIKHVRMLKAILR